MDEMQRWWSGLLWLATNCCLSDSWAAVTFKVKFGEYPNKRLLSPIPIFPPMEIAKFAFESRLKWTEEMLAIAVAQHGRETDEDCRILTECEVEKFEELTGNARGWLAELAKANPDEIRKRASIEWDGFWRAAAEYDEAMVQMKAAKKRVTASLKPAKPIKPATAAQSAKPEKPLHDAAAFAAMPCRGSA